MDGLHDLLTATALGHNQTSSDVVFTSEEQHARHRVALREAARYRAMKCHTLG